jgi:hypothetical protein
MVCGEPYRSAHFYEAALGFVQTGEASKAEPAFAKLIGIPDALARVITLQLGEQEIELVGVQPPGKTYPRAVSGAVFSFSIVRSWFPIWCLLTDDCRHMRDGKRSQPMDRKCCPLHRAA